MAQKTCFLVDDDEDDREIFALALESVDGDYECITARNGLEAVEKLSAGGFVPDFIFIDLNMPYMSGTECLEAIRKMPALAGTPIVVYTTSSRNRDLEDTRSLGAAHYMVKPPSIARLTSILSSILGRQPLPYFLGDTA